MPTGAELRRSGARPGDAVFVSGTLGDAALGLMALGGDLSELAEAETDELIDRYRLPRPRVSLGRALSGLASFSNERLSTEFTFVARHFTVMGLLWMVLSHHGFHLGQVDLLMRQNGLQPIEFLEWAETEKVVG